MISPHEKDDLLHIMKMNRFILTDSDSAQLIFSGQINDEKYKVKILVIEDQMHTIVERNEKKIYNELIKSVDDLKIFLEERFYQFLEV